MAKLFRVQFDGQSEYIEAENMPDAIGKWHRAAREQDPDWDHPETPEPDGVELVHDRPVIR